MKSDARPCTRRARPLLGTLVEMRVEGLSPTRAVRAIEHAFAEVADLHGLMSFQEPGSDLDRLHRARAGHGVRVDRRTVEVLTCALEIARASAGIFDPTVAVRQVVRGALPHPADSCAPDALTDWRAIEIVGDACVRLARPAWIDLGGIAKGYAVDRAIAILVDAGARQACVNAGGDLRLAGTECEIVEIRAAPGSPPHAALEIADAAVATSATTAACAGGTHLHGVSREPLAGAWAATVVASSCIVADALTKVVLAGDDDVARRVLAQFGAEAHRFSLDRARSAA